MFGENLTTRATEQPPTPRRIARRVLHGAVASPNDWCLGVSTRDLNEPWWANDLSSRGPPGFLESTQPPCHPCPAVQLAVLTVDLAAVGSSSSSEAAAGSLNRPALIGMPDWDLDLARSMHSHHSMQERRCKLGLIAALSSIAWQPIPTRAAVDPRPQGTSQPKAMPAADAKAQALQRELWSALQRFGLHGALERWKRALQDRVLVGGDENEELGSRGNLGRLRAGEYSVVDDAVHKALYIDGYSYAMMEGGMLEMRMIPRRGGSRTDVVSAFGPEDGSWSIVAHSLERPRWLRNRKEPSRPATVDQIAPTPASDPAQRNAPVRVYFSELDGTGGRVFYRLAETMFSPLAEIWEIGVAHAGAPNAGGQAKMLQQHLNTFAESSETKFDGFRKVKGALKDQHGVNKRISKADPHAQIAAIARASGRTMKALPKVSRRIFNPL